MWPPGTSTPDLSTVKCRAPRITTKEHLARRLIRDMSITCKRSFVIGLHCHREGRQSMTKQVAVASTTDMSSQRRWPATLC